MARRRTGDRPSLARRSAARTRAAPRLSPTPPRSAMSIDGVRASGASSVHLVQPFQEYEGDVVAANEPPNSLVSAVRRLPHCGEQTDVGDIESPRVAVVDVKRIDDAWIGNSGCGQYEIVVPTGEFPQVSFRGQSEMSERRAGRWPEFVLPISIRLSRVLETTHSGLFGKRSREPFDHRETG